MKRLILSLLLSLFLIGCGSNEFKLNVLDIAEEIMHEHPDSALNILSPYILKNVQGEEDKAKFALLYSQALDRNKIYITSDSLIKTAVAYYDKTNNAHYKTMSHYYFARVYNNKGDTKNTIKHFTIAKNHIPKDSYFMQGLVYGNLGLMYSMQESFIEAIDMYESALLGHKNSRDTVNYYRTLSNKSLTLYLMEHNDESLEIKYKVKEYAISKQDSARVYINSCDIASMLYKQNNHKGAYDELNNVALPYNRNKLDFRTFPMMSDFMLNEGKIDSARIFILSALENKHLFSNRENMDHFFQLQKIEEADGNYKKANYYANIAHQKSDSISIAEKNIQIQALEKEYQVQHGEDELIITKNRHKYDMVLLLFIIFSIIIISILLLLRLRLNKRNLQYQLSEYQILVQTADTHKSDLESRYNEIVSQNNDNDGNTVKLLNVINNSITNLKALINTANIYENNPKKFIANMKQHISTMSSKLNSDDDFIAVVNLHCNGIIDYFSNNFPELNSKDLHLLSCMCLGFSTIELQLIYNHSSFASTHNMRYRLREKLNLKASSESLETYIRKTILELDKK